MLPTHSANLLRADSLEMRIRAPWCKATQTAVQLEEYVALPLDIVPFHTRENHPAGDGTTLPLTLALRSSSWSLAKVTHH